MLFLPKSKTKTDIRVYLGDSVARSRGKGRTGCFVIKLWGCSWGTIGERCSPWAHKQGGCRLWGVRPSRSFGCFHRSFLRAPGTQLFKLLLPLVGVLSKFSNRKLTLCVNCLSEAFSRNGPHHDYQRISDAMQTR